jgi:hypothetical protein
VANEAKPGSVRARLQEAVHDAYKLNDQLEDIIGDPSRHPSSNTKRGKVSAAPIPWYSQAAFLIMDLHAWVRDEESLLRYIAQLPIRERGGSSSNTSKAMNAIISMGWTADDSRVESSCKWLEGWARRARIALGEVDQPQMLPRQPGCPQPKCPFCKHTTLRFWALRGEVRCINPECSDDEGRRPRAVVEISTFTMDWELVWQDGISGVPA